ncbi:uncharacterized protein LOC103696045 [Phoenix dactylifera]|uniref:Uncharacterized protein LOC103696045 n=1 Tax=Phoenix dactylifera TaxID=42345 RepID=A0A8B7BFR8_PHODC|nr:uncharacterized protein LOC103696045 [Phoenix dactylifera]
MAEAEAEVEEKRVMRGAVEGENVVEGLAVLDFDMLCATVALQTQGFSVEKRRMGMLEEEEEEEGGDFDGLQRMWEGHVLDCFEDRRIAIESACCPCYRFGRNMRRAKLGYCFLQGTVYFVLAILVLFNLIAFGMTKQHSFLFIGVASVISFGIYLGYFRTRMRKQFNIRGSDNYLDDCVNHLICPCCTLCQESRTLEMNNVQDGVWHGRGDTICLGSGEGNKAFIALQKPPLMPTRSPELCSMERKSDGGEHSWSTGGSHSEPLVPSAQLEQH